MLLLIYRIAIGGYDIGIRIASLFKEKAKLFVVGRQDWRAKLSEKIPAADSTPSVWFHCASLGEFEQGRPVIERIREVFPNRRLVLTFFSPSGYEVRKDFADADVVCYLPIDNPKNAHDFISIIKPEVAFFVKYEYWYFYLHELKSRGISTYLVSAIFREGHVFFKWYGALQRKMLHCVTRFFVQDENSLQLLARIGFSNVTLAGDTRYDRVVANAENAVGLTAFEKWTHGSVVLVAGSTWPKDEILLCELLQYKSDELKIIIVPHEISQAGIQRTLSLFGDKSVASSKWNQTQTNASCIVVDSVGLLSRLYQYADIAYVGGGFGSGIHNILEAAVFGTPVLFGPNYHRFREAVELIKAGGAFDIHNSQSLQQKVTELLSSQLIRERIKTINTEHVKQNAGATQRLMEVLGGS
ncbi:MAG: 3-deoxy-D-manno-octulosonic acid transferase [Bacteroidota bacterium]